jgi:hypothetical protein
MSANEPERKKPGAPDPAVAERLDQSAREIIARLHALSPDEIEPLSPKFADPFVLEQLVSTDDDPRPQQNQ